MARRGDGIYLRGRTWWLDFRHDGKRYVVRFGTQHQPDGRARHGQREAGGDPERGGGDLHEISRHTPLISSNTSSLVSRPFRTSTRRVASVSNIIARSSSSKVTTWRGSSFLAISHLTAFCRPCRDSPSLTPPILSAFSVESWLPAVNPSLCHANSVCLGFILCREGVPSLGVVKLECVSMSLLSPCHHRLRWPSP